MGRVRLVLVAGGLAVAACGTSSAPPAADSAPDPVLAAVAVWERGAEALAPPARPAPPVDREAGAAADDEPPVEEPFEGPVVSTTRAGPGGPFHDFDERTRGFLASPYVVDAVQFGCAVQGSADEAWVEAGLDDPDPVVRLRALVVLVRVRAPRTVAKQWAALQALRSGPRAVEFAEVTTRLDAAFSPQALDLALAEPPPGTEYSTPPAYQWALRAAGVTRHRGALERLTELSCSDLLDVSLAAERSLEDFEGPEGDAALARCVEGWRYNAAMRAANALLSRDPERLRATLLASTPPEREAYWKGVFLARLKDRRAVPLLCDEVPGLRIIDREMFAAIESLAGVEDLEQVEALPGRVREEQRPRAEEVVAAVRERLARER